MHHTMIIIDVILLLLFSTAAFGIVAYHEYKFASLWNNGWGTRMDALFITAGLILTLRHLIFN